MKIACRFHGSQGMIVALLHGGPGAPGSLWPLAEALKGGFRILEPFQTGSGGPPLTVQSHVEDFHELVKETCGASPVEVIGHSWGAMLGLAAAASHPEDIRSLALVGCGTFDPASRLEMKKTLESRMGENVREEVRALDREVRDSAERMRRYVALTGRFYSFDPEGSWESLSFDARAFEETWADMLRLQEEGVYPAAFSSVRCPVLMIHGNWDPHPGRMTRDLLARFIPSLQYVELPECGHFPWMEKRAREKFFSVLSGWLESQRA